MPPQTQNNNTYRAYNEGKDVITLVGKPLSFTSGAPNSLGDQAAFIATFMLMAIVVAGFGRVVYDFFVIGLNADNPSKGAFTKKDLGSTLGIILACSAFALLALYINPDVSITNIDFSKLSVTGNKTQAPLVTTPPQTGTPPGGTRSQAADAVVRKRFEESGIAINKPFPTTMLDNLPEETIQMILKLNSNCRCKITITGGTEPGHKTHGYQNGSWRRAVDLRITDPVSSDALYQFIVNPTNSTKVTDTGGCYARYRWYSAGTFTFCDEKPKNEGSFGSQSRHWHID